MKKLWQLYYIFKTIILTSQFQAKLTFCQQGLLALILLYCHSSTIILTSKYLKYNQL